MQCSVVFVRSAGDQGRIGLNGLREPLRKQEPLQIKLVCANGSKRTQHGSGLGRDTLAEGPLTLGCGKLQHGGTRNGVTHLLPGDVSDHLDLPDEGG